MTENRAFAGRIFLIRSQNFAKAEKEAAILRNLFKNPGHFLTWNKADQLVMMYSSAGSRQKDIPG